MSDPAMNESLGFSISYHTFYKGEDTSLPNFLASLQERSGGTKCKSDSSLNRLQKVLPA